MANNILYLLAISTLSLSLLAGCGKKEEPTGSIVGHLMYNGKPVDKAGVNFYDPVSRRSVAGGTDEQGSYECKGVRFGTYQVVVSQFTDPHSAGETPFDSRIPKQYRAFKTSKLEVTIESSEEPVTFDIDMK